MHKSRSEYRDGYKAHLAVEPETGLVTAAALTPANAGDGPDRRRRCSPARNPACRCSPTPPTAPARSAAALRAAQPPPSDQADPAATRRARRVRPRRLHHRPRRPHRHLPRRPHRHDHRTNNAVFETPLPRLPATRPLHHRQRRPQPHDPANTTPNSSKRDGPGDTATSPTTTDNGDRWSNAPSPGSSRTANRRVRYRGVERNQLGLVTPRRRHQPATARQPRPRPPQGSWQRRNGPSGTVKEGRLYGIKPPA